MTTPPALPAPSAARTSGHATASLVFGVAGFILPVLASIPAIILGHLALGRVRKSRGALAGNGLAIAGLVLGWGEPYHVILDGDHDEQLADPFGGPPLRGRRVATFSSGPNRRDDGGAGDDVKSW